MGFGLSRVLTASKSLSVTPPDRPKILRKLVVGEIAIRQREIAAHPPLSPPGVPDDKPSFGVFVTYREDGVAASRLFVKNRHRSAPSAPDLLRFKAFEHGEPNHERITRGETSFHVCHCSADALINKGGLFGCFDVTFSRRLLAKLPGSIRP